MVMLYAINIKYNIKGKMPGKEVRMMILNEVNTKFEKEYFNLKTREIFVSKLKSNDINVRNVSVFIDKKLTQIRTYDLNSKEEFKSYSNFYEKLLVEESEVWWP